MEFDYSKLRGKIKEVFKTQDNFAKKLGIGRVSLSQRLNNKLEFSQIELFKTCHLLNIPDENINEYFFCQKVQKSEQKRKEET